MALKSFMDQYDQWIGGTLNPLTFGAASSSATFGSCT